MKNKRIWLHILIVGLLCLGLFPLCGSSSTLKGSRSADIEELQEKLKREIQKSGADVSIVFQSLDATKFLMINPEAIMHAASLMKVPVMIEVFKQAEQGKFSLDEKINVKNDFKSIVDGSPYSLTVVEDSDDDIYQHIGKEMAIRELVHRMITVSSNLAANILIEFVGVENIRGTLAELEIQNMKVLRGVEDIKAYEKGLNNQTDALSMMQVMYAIAKGKAVSEKACQEMIEILAQQKYRNKIPSGIPEGVKVANKTGSITRIDHDAAIVFPEGHKPYVFVILTRGIEKREDAEKLIAELSRIVYGSVVNE